LNVGYYVSAASAVSYIDERYHYDRYMALLHTVAVSA